MNTKLFPAFCAGFGLGAIIAVMVAPKPGSAIRQDANNLVAAGVQKVHDGIEDTKAKVTNQIHNVDHAVKAGVAAYRKADATLQTV